MDGLRDLLDGIGVELQRVAQLQRRPGKLAQEQDAVLIEPTGHELLGDEIHPVVERADDAEVGKPVQGHHLDLVEIPLMVDHRLPFRGAPSPVDPLDELVDLRVDELILGDMPPAGDADLEER